MKHLFEVVGFARPYWKRVVLALVLLAAGVLLELGIPRLIQQLIDVGIGQGDMGAVTDTTLIMLGISILTTLFAIGNNILSVQVGEGFARDLREALFLKIQDFSFGNLDRLQTGQLIVRLTSDVSMLQRVVRMSIRIGTRAPLLLIGSVMLMINTNRQLTLSLLPLLLTTGVIVTIFIVRMGPLFLSVQERLDKLNTVLQENIAGVRVVKAFVRKQHEMERFEEANQGYTDRSIVVMQVTALLFPILAILINIGVVIVIWAGGLQAINGELSIGEIVAFSNYLLTTMTPLGIMAMLSNVVAGAAASAERVNEVLHAPVEVQESSQAVALGDRIQGRVSFENVGFHYNGASDEPVLQGVNLVAEPGQTIAILGATGAGKSTLVNLIPRFYDVSEGRVTVDGIDIRDIQQDSLLAHIGIALQETVLFSGSVRDNIRYGRPEASHQQVEAAARAAQAHAFIEDLPQGYETSIEPRGTNLSGGQKQRIAIARALLLEPEILILDDSTSAVDVETETRIQGALDELMVGRTSFVVAQRISTVLNADQIVVIDRGHIVARGKHAELLASSPIYQEIYDSQLGNGVTLKQIRVSADV